MSTLKVDTIQHSGGTTAATIDNSGNTTLSGNLKVDTIQHSGGTSGMTINSTGRVSTPNKVAFYSVGNNNAYVTTSPIVVPTVRYNVGSGYDNSNGRFTCPSGGAGLYRFDLHMSIVYSLQASANCYPRMWIANSSGTTLASPYSYNSFPDAGSYRTAHMSVSYDLAEGDYVILTFTHTNAKYYAGVGELAFSGIRIG